MSIKSFQTALAKVIADTVLCKHYKEHPNALSKDFDLTEKELERLTHMISQQGMRVNSMLYQMNRLTPLINFMPYTVKLLDANIERITKEFWALYDKTPFQFHDELAQFNAFIRNKINTGIIDVPYLSDILNFEEAYIDIRFQYVDPENALPANGKWVLSPTARIITMEFNPYELLDAVVRIKPGDPLPKIARVNREFLLKYTDNVELVDISAEMVQYFKMGYGNIADELFEELLAHGYVTVNKAVAS